MSAAAAEEDGYTLIELMVASAMMLVVLAAIGPMLVATIHLGGNQSNRVTDLDQDRVAFDQMGRDLRQASCVTPTVPGRSVTIASPNASTGACSTGTPVLRLDCGVAGTVAGTYNCVRTILSPTVSSRILIQGIKNTNPLTVTTTTGGGRSLVTDGVAQPSTTVAINLQVPDAGSTAGRSVQLQGAVTLRTSGKVL